MDDLLGVTAVLRSAAVPLLYRVVGGWISLFVDVVCPRTDSCIFIFFSFFLLAYRPGAGHTAPVLA